MVTRDRAMMGPQWQLLRASINTFPAIAIFNSWANRIFLCSFNFLARVSTATPSKQTTKCPPPDRQVLQASCDRRQVLQICVTL